MDLVISPTADGYRATYGDKTWRCAVGRGGLALEKREGDGTSPIGCWPIRRIFYRADRLDGAPSKAFTCTPIGRQDGWCDAPDHPDYNRPVRLPFAASHEEIWRDALGLLRGTRPRNHRDPAGNKHQTLEARLENCPDREGEP